MRGSRRGGGGQELRQLGAEPPVQLGRGAAPARAARRCRPGNFPCRAQEASPRRSRQRPADADPSYANRGQLGHGGQVGVGQHVHRPGGYRRHDCADSRACECPARRGTRRQPRRRRSGGESSPPESGRPTMKPSERAVSTTPVPLGIDRPPRCRMRSTESAKSTSGRSRSPVESSIDSPATPVVDAAGDVGRDAFGSTAKPPSKSALTGSATDVGDRLQVRERLVERDAVVRPADRPREAGAGRGQRGKTQLRQHARAAGIPRVRHHETSGRMEVPEPVDHG